MSGQTPNSGGGSSKSVIDFINFPRGAIGKRGLPAARNARLPSIRNPRDLTLGGLSLGVPPKRTFVPNIPVRKEKAKDSNTSSSTDEGKLKIESPQNKRKDFKSERGRGGRGRNRPQYIQTGGIFSEGIAVSAKKSSSSSYSNEPAGIPRPRMPAAASATKSEVKNENDDKNLLENLLRDDFIDDGSDDEKDAPYPVFLPFGSGFSMENKVDDNKSVIPIKKEKTEVKTEEEISSPMEISDIKPNVAIKSEPIEASEIFIPQDVTEDRQLLFFQFPDVLGVPPQPEESQSQTKNSQDASTSEDTQPPSADGVRLADFPEGYIGKLQVLKSGKTRLVLGSLVLDVKMGAPFSTLQDLVSVRTGGSGGDMTVLGHVHHKLVCMPDVENLMSQCSL